MAKDGLRIDVLVDNTVRVRGVRGEHGLSLLVRWAGRTLLFDTGQSDLFAHNAGTLGLDLSAVDVAVLSHGHYDHGGGLPTFFAVCPGTQVVTHPASMRARWSCKPESEARSIGLSSEARGGRDRFRFHEDPVDLGEGCTYLGAVPRKHPEGCGTKHFFLDPECERPDEVIDDSGVVIDTARGLVVITGCCHAGVTNYLARMRELWPSRPIHMLLGGLHLGAAEPAEMNEAIDAINAAGVQSVGAMHCTGFRGARALSDATGFATRVLDAGAVVRL